MPAKDRIVAAFSPELLEEMGNRLATLLAQHFRQVQSDETAVLNWRLPADNVADAKGWMDGDRPAANDDEELVDRFAVIVQAALDGGMNLHHRRYAGHQVPASVPLAGWFDAVGSVTNQVMAIYEMGPWASAVEQAVLNVVGEKIGFASDRFGGLITSGASLANLTALSAARNVSLDGIWEQGVWQQGVWQQGGWQGGWSSRKAPVLVTHTEAHYSVTRSAGILGIGTDHLIKAPMNARRATDPEQLDTLLGDLRRRGVPIVAMSAAACATPIGAFDSLPDIVDVCRRHEVWLHVDAAHGGAACMSRKYRHLIEGLDGADSVVCDAHKMFFMPALCALLFYRNAEHAYCAFDQQAPYLFDPLAGEVAEYDSGKRTLECTKRAAAYGLWGTWSLFGPQLFEDMVDTTFDLGQAFYELLDEAEDFEALYPPECNIVAFRYCPAGTQMSDVELDEFQLRLRRRVIESGDSYLVANRLDGQNVLRTTIINPLTRIEDLGVLLDYIRFHGKRLLD